MYERSSQRLSHRTTHDRRRLRWRTRAAITLGTVATLVATPFVVNALTPRPYAAIFKALIGRVDSSVTLGPYADRIEQITASNEISIPVDGAPDARLTVYTAVGTSPSSKPVVLLIHGGGWVVGAASQVSAYAKLLASEGFVVANLDYSLAPQQRYPTPIRQAAAAIDFLHGQASQFGGDPTKLFVAGNSAGAQMAGQLAAMVTNSTLQREVGIDLVVPPEDLRGVVLYSGPYDFDTIEKANFPAFRLYAWNYLGQKDYENYPRLDELSTVKGATSDYPATYLTSGDADPLEPQTYELDAVLRSKGVDVTSRYWTGSGRMLPHDYIFDLSTDAGQTAFQDTVRFVDEQSR